jgi:transcriptional regulator with XRE-family HTH domain
MSLLADDWPAVVAQLRARRLALGRSQEATAAAVGVNTAQIARWEKQHDRPRSDLLFAWAAALGCGVQLVDRTPRHGT